MLFRHVYILYHCFIKIKHNLTNFKKSALGSFPKANFSVFVYILLFFFIFFTLFRQFTNNRQTSKKCNQVWKHH